MTETIATPTTAQQARRRFVAVCLGSSLIILDANVLNVAAPTIRAELGGGPDELLWVLDSYILVFASLLLVGGALGQRFGQVRAFLAGSTIFVAASALCAVAPGTPLLLAGRALQGVGAALVAPSALTLVAMLFTDPQRRAKAFGTWAGIQGIAFAAGPIVGGALVAVAGWRSIFVLNIPLGLGVIAALRTWRPEEPHRLVRIPLVPQCLGVVALAAITLGLIETSRWGWTDPKVLAAVAVSVLAGLALWRSERASAAPLVSRAVLASRTGSAALVVGAIFNFCLYGTLFVFTVQLQDDFGYSALETGIAFMPLTGAGALMSAFVAGRLTARLGPRRPLALGLGLGATGALLLAVAASHGHYLPVALGFLVFGLGSGMTTPPLTTAMMGAVGGRDASSASALFNTARQLGGVLGVALLGAIVTAGHPALACAIACAAFLVGAGVTLRRI